jgi:hypothetical protein
MVVFGALGVGTVSAQAPEGPPPVLAAVKLGKGDTLEVSRQVAVTRYKEVTRQVEYTVIENVNGKAVEVKRVKNVTEAIPETTVQTVAVAYALKAVEVYNLKWRRVTAENLAKALGDNLTAVIMLQRHWEGDKETFSKIDPLYLQAFKEGTLIVVLPAPPRDPGVKELPPPDKSK